MIQIKKTILTLVALLAVTTGAWAADVLNIVVSGTSATIKYDSNANNNPYFGGDEWKQSEFPWDDEYTTRPTITTVTIDGSCKNFSGTRLRSLFIGFSGLTTINGLENLNTANVQDMKYMFAGCSSLTSLDLSSFNTANVTTMYSMFDGCSKLTTVDLSGWNTENVEKINALFYNCSELTTVDLSSWNTAKVWNTGYMFYNCPKLENIYVGDGWSTAAVTQSDYMFKGCTKLLSMNTANPATDKTNAHTGDGGYLKVKPAAATAVDDFAWDEAKKTGTFTMPGDNVTVSVEYYDLATLADKGLTAAVDAAAKTEAPLAVLAENAITGGTVMYYVAPDANFSQADAIALAQTAWSADIPTAETIDAAGGTCYVWYYIKGDDEHSDTDPQLLQVTVLPEPTYAVTFAEGTQDADKWTVKAGTDGSFQSLPLKGVKAGTKVKLKYDGDRSMLKGVKAVKKAAAGIVNPVVGQVIGSDGKNYDANATLPDGVTAVAVIAYVGSETGDDTYKNGLAIALADESNSNWSTAKSTCEGKSAVSGAAWLLPSQKQWKTMFKANGGNEGSYSGLNTAIGTAGGTALQVNERYWSSSELDADFAWVLVLGENSAGWDGAPEDLGHQVRACLAF